MRQVNWKRAISTALVVLFLFFVGCVAGYFYANGELPQFYERPIKIVPLPYWSEGVTW